MRSGTHGTPSRKPSRSAMRPLDWMLIIVGLAVLAWLIVPGVGPNILNLGQEDSLVYGESDNNIALIADLKSLETVSDHKGIPRYDRAEFGEGWADLDGDGCSTRNEILARDLARPSFRPNTNDCVVQTGTLAEPYLGETVDFVRGQGTSELVQIDHVVALADAWRAGAWEWDASKRLEFANDPLNLLAVDGQANYDKGALTADEWLPPNQDFQCEFIARQVAVKAKWGLSVTDREADTMWKILQDCPEISLTQ